jgi:dihydrofolate reductase
MTPGGKTVTMVAAVAENGVIGLAGNIPWHLPEDFAHFKETTSGHILILGRTTHEGIGKPLPNRTTIVLTSDSNYIVDGDNVGFLMAPTLLDALALADTMEGDVMIGGGAAVYAAALPYADVQIISEVGAAPEGDTHYPDFSRSRWREVSREPREGFDIVRWERAFACGGSD